MQDITSVFKKIIKLLDESGVKYNLSEHKPVYTSSDAARVRGTDPSIGAKAMVFSADKTPILIIVPGNKRVDSKGFKKQHGVKDLRICSADEVKKITGLEIGSVPPFGNLMNLTTYVDRDIKRLKEIAFNAGSHIRSIIMKSSDFINLVEPIIGEYSC